MSMNTDEALYCQYLDGDEDGLKSLMEKYGNSLTLYINGYVHDVHDAEDLMLEAFVRIIVKHPTLKEGAFRPYIYKTARRLALRFVRKKRLQLCFDSDILEEDLQGAELVERIILDKERDGTLHQCMDQLNPDYREALYLTYFENLRHSEVAVVMGKSEKQVADLVYRGKKSLRKHLKQEGITGAQY